MKQKLIGFVNSLPILVSAAVSLAASGVARAQSVAAAPAAIVTNADSLAPALFCPIINTMFYVLISVAIIMVFWAAYTYLTAGDDTEKVHRATKTMTYAAVAVVVALLAKGFPALIGSIFSSSSLNATWTCASS